MENDLMTKCEIIEWKFSGAEVGDLFLKVKADPQNLTLDCFISGDTLYALAIKRLYNGGDSVKVRLSLLAYDRSFIKPRDTSKSIVPDPKSKEGSNEYIIRGQVVKVYPDEGSYTLQDHQRLIVNCGFDVYTRVPLTYVVKVGDYIQMQGRLDAHIVGKVK